MRRFVAGWLIFTLIFMIIPFAAYGTTAETVSLPLQITTETTSLLPQLTTEAVSFNVTFLSSAEVSGVKVKSFWTEFDITFWQTFPFAVFWSYLVAQQFSQGQQLNWLPVVNVAIVISAANAYFQARDASQKKN